MIEFLEKTEFKPQGKSKLIAYFEKDFSQCEKYRTVYSGSIIFVKKL